MSLYYTSDTYVIDMPVKTHKGWTFNVHTFEGILVRECTYCTKSSAMKARTRERRTRMSEGAKVIYI